MNSKTQIKTTFKIILWTTLILLVTSVLSYRNRLPVDGALSFGFPFAVYKTCGDCEESCRWGFQWDNLILNTLIYTLIVSLVIFTIRKAKKK
jgi:hypothetical protein